MNEDCARALRYYLESHHGDLTDVDNLAETLFNAGARRAIESMVSFSNVSGMVARVDNQVHGLLALLETFRDPVEVGR